MDLFVSLIEEDVETSVVDSAVIHPTVLHFQSLLRQQAEQPPSQSASPEYSLPPPSLSQSASSEILSQGRKRTFEEAMQSFQLEFCPETVSDYRDFLVVHIIHANVELSRSMCLLSGSLSHDPLPRCRDGSSTYKMKYKFHKGNFSNHLQNQHPVFYIFFLIMHF